MITGQKPLVTRAKKSIAGFKLREGNAIGAKVTLRGDRMWEFYDRLVSLAIPRIRDFRGLNPKSFDGRGNYTFGVTEQLIFPEIDYDKIDTVRGHGHHDRHDRHAPTTRAARCCARSGSRSAATKHRGRRWRRRHSSRSSSAEPKFKVRGYTRCRRCGRARSVYRKFGLCRICLRELAHAGEVPGVTKASW